MTISSQTQEKRPVYDGAQHETNPSLFDESGFDGIVGGDRAPAITGNLEPSSQWCSDNWETPDEVAEQMASLVLPSDRRILEPAAGTGQIVKFLPSDRTVECIEINRSRCLTGFETATQGSWFHQNFLTKHVQDGWNSTEGYDLVITNPPFTQAIAFIQRGLEVLNKDYEHARLLYLLPTDFDQSVKRNDAMRSLDCHIHHVYKIVNRVAYLKDGKQVKGRQIYDAVFDIRPGQGGCVSYFCI